jgi:diguanylate cyclase (GGDEF)-like protein
LNLQRLTVTESPEYSAEEWAVARFATRRVRLRGPIINQFASTSLAGAFGPQAALLLGSQNGHGALNALFDAMRGLLAGSRLEASLLNAQMYVDHLVHHDQLTGVPNRLFLAAHLPDMLKRTAQQGQSLALVFLDLDRFQDINDSCGHDQGDRLLRAVAQRIRTTARLGDLVVRMGDDEFVVILQDVQNDEQVEAALKRILEALREPFDIEGRSLATSGSAGASLYPQHGADMCQLLRHAGAALAHAKAQGRNRGQIYSPCLNPRPKRPPGIESRLRRAIQQGHLEVHYQPIVDIGSQQVAVLESLVRWRDPADGLIPPDNFIGIAEETGLIVPLGEFVLERALQDMGRWRASGCRPVSVAVNVSAVQLRRSNFPARLLALTQKHGVSPSRLQVELTESTACERPEGGNGELIEDPVRQLRALGVHIAIDDFGTRYSSLSYLKQWDVDSLKIDRAFVRDLATNSSDLAIVAAICEMARRLQIPVVAEGVEDRQQLEILRELGCPLVQGYLFSKPVPAEQCTPCLRGAPIEIC